MGGLLVWEHLCPWFSNIDALCCWETPPLLLRLLLLLLSFLHGCCSVSSSPPGHGKTWAGLHLWAHHSFCWSEWNRIDWIWANIKLVGRVWRGKKNTFFVCLCDLTSGGWRCWSSKRFIGLLHFSKTSVPHTVVGVLASSDYKKGFRNKYAELQKVTLLNLSPAHLGRSIRSCQLDESLCFALFFKQYGYFWNQPPLVVASAGFNSPVVVMVSLDSDGESMEWLLVVLWVESPRWSCSCNESSFCERQRHVFSELLQGELHRHSRVRNICSVMLCCLGPSAWLIQQQHWLSPQSNPSSPPQPVSFLFYPPLFHLPPSPPSPPPIFHQTPPSFLLQRTDKITCSTFSLSQHEDRAEPFVSLSIRVMHLKQHQGITLHSLEKRKASSAR